PCANPLAYQANSRHTPLDMLNLNRVFPGDPDGWFTERLAEVITRRLLSSLDAYVDLHSGGAFPTVDYVYVFTDERLSRSFGSRFLYRPAQPFAGTAAGVVAARGRPAMVVELGGGDVDQREYVERGVRGLLDVMRALDMLAGPPATSSPMSAKIRRRATPRILVRQRSVNEAHDRGAKELEVSTVGWRNVEPGRVDSLRVLSYADLRIRWPNSS